MLNCAEKDRHKRLTKSMTDLDLGRLERGTLMKEMIVKNRPGMIGTREEGDSDEGEDEV